MNKKIIALLICMVMLFATSVFAVDSGIKVTIDGVGMTFTDNLGYPMEYNDRVMLPLRQVFGAFGWSPTYDETTGTVMAFKDKSYIAMQIGSLNYFINGKTFPFDTAPIIVNDRTLVPIRIVAESLDYNVTWDDANKTVIINTKK